MRPIRRALVAAAFVFAAFVSVPRDLASASTCPPGTAALPVSVPIDFDSSQFDTTTSEPGLGVTSHAACDLVAGTMSVEQPGLYPGSTYLFARDRFDVTGVPTGTVVPVVAELVVDGVLTSPGCGGSGCGAQLFASIASQAAYDERREGGMMFIPEVRALHFVIRLPLELVAGTPRDVAFHLLAGRGPGGSHAAEGSASYRIVDVPAGVTVVSCRGLAQTPTPALPATWGSVKAAYR